MRTRKSTVFLLVSFVYLCCFVQQCHFLAFQTLASALGNSVGSAVQMTGTLGITMMSSLMQSFLSTFAHGFSTLHTMTMSLISGFIMGNLALAAFIFFLLAVVPAEEDFRSLGGSNIFSPYRHLITYHTPNNITISNATAIGHGLQFNNSSSLIRHKRASLVNNAAAKNNATDEPFTLPASLARITYAEDIKNGPPSNNSEGRIPRFLSRLVQQDPLNCLPLLLCGLSAARKPSERTEVLNDYAYILKEFMTPDEDDKSEEDESQEEGLKNRNKNRFRSPLDAREQLAALFRSKVKKKDEVDKMIDQMQEDEDDKIEELVLTEMAEDPNDLKYALDDMKVRGLKKTMSKMPPNSKKSYIAKLMKEDSLEAELGEDMDPEMRMPIRFMGNRPRHDYPMPMAPDSSMEDSYYYNTRELVRGGFPPPPQTPPVPHGGRKGNHELYEKNFKILEETLGPPPPGYRPRGPPPHMMGRREKKNMQWGGPPPRGFLQKKRGEVEEADNIFDRSRIGAEVGTRTRNNRQCRSLFNQCPINSIAKPADEGQPFLNRAVNNIRRVILGGPSQGSTKQRRISEIKEVIEQLQPHRGLAPGSEVKVVLNIGPSPPPGELHRSGINAPTNHPGPTPPHYPTAKLPSPSSTKKTMTYHSPPSPTALNKPLLAPLSTRSTVPLESLEQLLKATSASMSEEGSTDMPEFEETTMMSENILESSASVENDEPGSVESPKDKYAQNLRETIDIFKRFKEAHHNPKKSIQTTPKPKHVMMPIVKTTMISPFEQEQRNVTRIMNKLALALAGKKPPNDNAQDDVDDDGEGSELTEGFDIPSELGLEHEESDLNEILQFLKKFRIKNKPKLKGKGKKKKKKRKKKKQQKHSSSEESSEEVHHYQPPPLVAVPPPHIRTQIHWKSGSTALKDGFYHLLFGKRVAKPLPPLPVHFDSGEDESKKPSKHDVHYYVPHYRHTDSDISAEDDIPGPSQPPSLPPPKATEASSSVSGSSESSTAEATSKSPTKLKLKNPKPLVIPQEESDEEDDDGGDDTSRSMEYDSFEDVPGPGPSPRPTRPQLVFTPFTHVSPLPKRRKPVKSVKATSKPKPKKSKGAKTRAEAARSSGKKPTLTTTPAPKKILKNKGGLYTTGRTTTVTTTAKPKRKIMRYKNG